MCGVKLFMGIKYFGGATEATRLHEKNNGDMKPFKRIKIINIYRENEKCMYLQVNKLKVQQNLYRFYMSTCFDR